jgi:hypothetical protein
VEADAHVAGGAASGAGSGAASTDDVSGAPASTAGGLVSSAVASADASASPLGEELLFDDVGQVGSEPPHAGVAATSAKSAASESMRRERVTGPPVTEGMCRPLLSNFDAVTTARAKARNHGDRSPGSTRDV